ncbi:MAG: RcnB family protein [Henriciella sp.]|uniref:RcnB family protein n=1 Tax=Henriciella sp. TaxID=1968823 RepID=UPI003C742FEB
MLKIILTAVAAIALSGMIHADPPSPARGETLPPGLGKHSKVPPGQTKKIWHRGEMLPVRYRDARIADWERYDLRRAPEGLRWVRVEDEAYLISISSGIIADAIGGVFD